MNYLFTLFFTVFLQTDYKWLSRLKPVGVSRHNLRRYMGIVLLRVLDVSPHRHRQRYMLQGI